MKNIKVLIVGIGGYGNLYVSYFKDGYAGRKNVTLAGVVDPYAQKASSYQWILDNKIPVYNNPEEFFRKNRADLTIVSTPTNLHSPSSITAMRNGSSVLCEKPLTVTLQELDHLEAQRKKYKKELAVGFQWSFSKTMSHVKQDILAGKYGKPIMLKAYVSAPRPLSYYGNSTWKGRIKNDSGEYVLDSVVTNATAHYLHNLFFVLGESMDKAAYPTSLRAELYRAKELESFDTCILKGKIAGGDFFYTASHATALEDSPKFCYQFENGSILLNADEENDKIVGKWKDGTVTEYGNPFTFEETLRKIEAMVSCVSDGGRPQCGIQTVRPHLLTCNAIFDYGTIHSFPKEVLRSRDMEDPQKANIYCEHLREDLLKSYELGVLPSDLGFSWSRHGNEIPVQNYQTFAGR